MAYEVTATRKRPQTFEKLVGQEFTVSTIENAIESGRIAHAYLFSGPRGVGKTSSARLLAKALNCEHGPTAHPCGQCASCRAITAGSSMDVIEIDGASNTGVNDIRAIKDEVLFPPSSSRYKIYIIDEVHMLSNSAFNALLKTIEEPPEYLIFIFATTELQKVPATIRSRCQQFRFQLIGLEQIKSCLKEAADEMGIAADDDALFWIAREATGSMRDAYTLFDQVASFSRDHITMEKISKKLGIVGLDRISDITRLALSGQRKEAQETLASLLSGGISVEQCIKDFSSLFRSLLLAKSGITNEEILSERIEDLPQDVLSSLSASQLEAALRTLMQTYREIRYSLSPRFELELFVSRLSSLPYLSSNEELVQKLEALKSDVTEGKVTVVKEKVSVPVIASPAPASSFQSEKKTAPVTNETHETVVTEAKPEKAEPVETQETAVPEAEAPREESKAAAPVSYDTENVKNILADSSSWDLSNASGLITGTVIKEDGTLEIQSESNTCLKMLQDNAREIKELLSFDGGVTFKLTEKPKLKIDPRLELIEKTFRGNVVPKEKKKETEK